MGGIKFMFFTGVGTALDGRFIVGAGGGGIYIPAFLVLLIVLMVVVLASYLIWLANRHMKRAIFEHANIDEITGYGNYSKFVDDANIMLKYNDMHYVVGYIDISNFKSINDFYGRKCGDLVLKTIADRVHDIVIPDGICARIFADRFVFMVSYLDLSSLEYMVETHLSEVDFEIPEVNSAIRLKCNCGIYRVDDYRENVNNMVDKASMAAKISKNSISKMVTVLEKDINATIVSNQKMTYMMNEALNNHEFVPYIQPKVSFRDGRIVGGEALVRWMSSDGGMIPPDKFIPLFEQNGFVTNVDFYMLEKICSMLKKREEWGKRNVPISVNQSRVHVYDNMYINKLINTFDKYGIDKENIIFELTESAFTENTDEMIVLIKRMKTLGYRISMDDFGCGYSSLNMLNLLPINELKIDKAFLDDESPKSRFIIKTIVELAHGLGISIVCEGVETDEQVRFLRHIGCDVAQGYYYARPMPMNEFEKMLDGRMSMAK